MTNAQGKGRDDFKVEVLLKSEDGSFDTKAFDEKSVDEPAENAPKKKRS